LITRSKRCRNGRAQVALHVVDLDAGLGGVGAREPQKVGARVQAHHPAPPGGQPTGDAPDDTRHLLLDRADRALYAGKRHAGDRDAERS